MTANRFSCWASRHPWLSRAALLGLSLLALEICARIAVGIGLAPYSRYPTTAEPTLWDVLSPSWGPWRHPSGSAHVITPCFDLVYRANAEGMRDRERSRRSSAQRRLVVLGDSFTEGIGVDRATRFTDRVEHDTGLECLNFGLIGSGFVQHLLIYRDLAHDFDHSHVALFTLPYNDALDSDPDHIDRYAPFLVADAEAPGGYRIDYPMPFEDRPRERRSLSVRIRNWLGNNLYLVNLGRTAARTLKSDHREALAEHRSWDMPSYRTFGPREQAWLCWCYRQLVAAAGGRPVHVFLIPTRLDFEDAMTREPDAPRAPGDLRIGLEALDRELPDLHVHDLLPRFVDDAHRHARTYDDYTLWCDGHWNALGHEIAAAALREVLD